MPDRALGAGVTGHFADGQLYVNLRGFDSGGGPGWTQSAASSTCASDPRPDRPGRADGVLAAGRGPIVWTMPATQPTAGQRDRRVLRPGDVLPVLSGPDPAGGLGILSWCHHGCSPLSTPATNFNTSVSRSSCSRSTSNDMLLAGSTGS
jgi:hypothetical protein